mgnify:FL=1
MQSDRVTVLRRGRKIATVDTAGVTSDELSEMMVGRRVRPVTTAAAAPVVPAAEPLLSVGGLRLALARSRAAAAIAGLPG